MHIIAVVLGWRRPLPPLPCALGGFSIGGGCTGVEGCGSSSPIRWVDGPVALGFGCLSDRLGLGASSDSVRKSQPLRGPRTPCGVFASRCRMVTAGCVYTRLSHRGRCTCFRAAVRGGVFAFALPLGVAPPLYFVGSSVRSGVSLGCRFVRRCMCLALPNGHWAQAAAGVCVAASRPARPRGLCGCCAPRSGIETCFGTAACTTAGLVCRAGSRVYPGRVS